MTEHRLPGGRSFGAVRVGDEVRRPSQPWTATVHSVLRHLEGVGFEGAPRARGFDEQGRERLTFLRGETLGETMPWPDWLRSDDALRQVGGWLRRLHDATVTFEPAVDAVWFTGRSWQPGLLIAHLDASPWNAVWNEDDGTLVGFVDWDTASPSRREDDLAFSALTWVPLLTAEIAEPVGFGDASDRRRRFHLLLDAYHYEGERTAIRDALLGRVERNVAMIRQLADGGEPTFQRMLPWAADLERSGSEVAELPTEFWQVPGR
jgi:phosphotransferase family enzyme